MKKKKIGYLRERRFHPIGLWYVNHYVFEIELGTSNIPQAKLSSQFWHTRGNNLFQDSKTTESVKIINGEAKLKQN